MSDLPEKEIFYFVRFSFPRQKKSCKNMAGTTLRQAGLFGRKARIYKAKCRRKKACRLKIQTK